MRPTSAILCTILTSDCVALYVHGTCDTNISVSTRTVRSEFRRVNITNAIEIGAVCNDRSSGLYYLSTVENSTHWIVFLEGGVGCSSVDECKVRYVKHPELMTSHLYPALIQGRGIFDIDPAVNPDYWNYNYVLIPYCTSDLWIGNSTWDEADAMEAENVFQFDFQSETNQFAFRGSPLFRSVVRDLILDNGLSAADDVSPVSVLFVRFVCFHGTVILAHTHLSLVHCTNNRYSLSSISRDFVYTHVRAGR